MGWIREIVTKIILLFKALFGSINSYYNTSQQQDAPVNSGRISSYDNTHQQLDAPMSSIPTSPVKSTDSNASTLPLPLGEYEVFLSFRGPDTRRQITDLLYRFLVHLKIRTFRDDDELRLGEGIWPELRRAIGQSKIYVLILSESYAHSKWCLKELAEIVEHRRRDAGHIVLPIFYMVDPRDVRHQTGPYEDAFRRHEIEFDEGIVQKWKDALKEVGSLKGWHIKTKEEEGAIADLVSSTVYSHLSKNNSALETGELVGIEEHVEEVVHKLSLDVGSVSTVGIHGIGGIGKTTLAMAVYNKISARFNRCSFLENIREMQQQKDGTLALQKKLISNVLRWDSVASVGDTHEGRRIIKDRVSQFRVLVVLDDVDENFKFDEVLGNLGNFISGSRFIITTRNVKVLRNLGENHNPELYEVHGMSPERSLQLFCKHSFKMDSPLSGFETLSKDIVSTTGGLPLTLKVVGSFLFREEVDVWKDKLAQLRKMPEKEVMGRLKISYDSLDNEAQQIFLDIACFFIGEDKEIVSYMWSDLNFFPAKSISVLIERSMIKIGDHNEFQMHDQLRDTGREIVRTENIEHPWMRSRIWSHSEAKELLLNKKGTDQIKAIKTEGLRDLENEHVSNLSELRYFDGTRMSLIGDFSGLLPNLRWLRLKHHQKSSNDHLTKFDMRNLVIFHFSDAEVEDDWGGWSNIKMANKLKVLDLSNPLDSNLTKLPEFPESGSLEMLNLYNFGCQNIRGSGAELDIRNLWDLKVLNLNNCSLRKIKGGTFGTMKRLRVLDITNIPRAENLSESLADIGELSSLEILRAEETNSLNRYHAVEVLAGITLPTNLKVLTTSSAVANLTDLLEIRELKVNWCRSPITIPNTTSSTWWKSSKLQFLTLEYAPNLVMVPNATLLPSSLTRLSIDYVTLTWLPNLENLKNLVELKLDGCVQLTEVHGLDGLKSLQSLTISNSDRLTRLHGLDGLKSLLSLTISDSRCLTRLHGLGSLMSSSHCKMTKLRIWRCPSLVAALDCSFGTELLPDDVVLISLQEMEIDGCPRLHPGSIPRLSMLPRLKNLRLGGILQVDKFNNGTTSSSTTTMIEGLENLVELVELLLVNLPTVARLPPLSKLRELRRLVVWDIPALREIEGLEDLKSLQRLHVGACTSLERFPAASLPSSLEWLMLDLRGCTNLAADLVSGLTIDRSRLTLCRKNSHSHHNILTLDLCWSSTMNLWTCYMTTTYSKMITTVLK